jgi:hypothetical protein
MWLMVWILDAGAIAVLAGWWMRARDLAASYRRR